MPPSARSILFFARARSLARSLAPGLALAVALGTVAFFAGQHTRAMSPLMWALLLGVLLGNAIGARPLLQPGIVFAAKELLRFGVALLGIRLAVGPILAVGAPAVAVVIGVVVLSFVVTVRASKMLGLSDSLGAVLGAGTSICGAAAIVAVSGVVAAREEEMAVALATVTALGTVGIVVYPIAGHALGMDATAFALWTGASIHEVAQVVATAAAFDGGTAAGGAVDIATVVKLGRVLLLAPLVLYLSWSWRARRGGAGQAKVPLVPWFILLFIVFVAVKSLGVLPDHVEKSLEKIDAFILAVAMAGLGLDLRWATIKAAGPKPVWAGVAGWIAMAGVSLAAALALQARG